MSHVLRQLPWVFVNFPIATIFYSTQKVLVLSSFQLYVRDQIMHIEISVKMMGVFNFIRHAKAVYTIVKVNEQSQSNLIEFFNQDGRALWPDSV